MINPAVVVYTFLLQIRKLGKSDIVLHVLLFLYAVCCAIVGPEGVNMLIGLIFSPMVSVTVAYRFTSDNMKFGNEYYALLFTRPIKRFDYLMTKAFVG
jgi:hypothetical protein